MVKKLITRGADINYGNREGKTALIMAVEKKMVNVIRFLLEEGAYAHIEDLTGRDACDYAKEMPKRCA